MHRTVLRLSHAIGRKVLTGKRASDIALAMRLHSLFSLFSIDTVIDVGANEGQYHDFLRDRVGFHGQVESFEPVPALAARLLQRAATDSRWTIHACALGATDGESTLNVMASTQFSSFRGPRSLPSAIPNPKEDINRMNTVTETVTVPVRTLDSMFAGRDGLRHTYIKLDTQGFDLEVLRGGARTIEQVPALQTEISFQPIYEDMPDYQQSIAAFARHGFRVADLLVISRDAKQRAVEFDCIMVR